MINMLTMKFLSSLYVLNKILHYDTMFYHYHLFQNLSFMMCVFCVIILFLSLPPHFTTSSHFLNFSHCCHYFLIMYVSLLQLNH
jgi:hypothetical protein